MDKFERTLQCELLMALHEAFPYGIEQKDSLYFKEKFGGKDNFIANLKYLEGHGLIISGTNEMSVGNFIISPLNIRITSKGIDFIQDDGGLSAILNVQTIKFHRDAVVILEDLIAISNMSEEQKEQAKSTISELSLEALKTFVQAATAAGLAAL